MPRSTLNNHGWDGPYSLPSRCCPSAPCRHGNQRRLACIWGSPKHQCTPHPALELQPVSDRRWRGRRGAWPVDGTSASFHLCLHLHGLSPFLVHVVPPVAASACIWGSPKHQWATPTRPAIPCDSRCRGNQCRTLPVREEAPEHSPRRPASRARVHGSVAPAASKGQRRVHTWAALWFKTSWLALMLVRTFSQCQTGGGGGGGGRGPPRGPRPALMPVLIFMACLPCSCMWCRPWQHLGK
jgi:hypothetical protein